MIPLPITIGGAVVKEFDISGRGWDRVREVLNLGEIENAKGKQQTLNVWVRGPEWESGRPRDRQSNSRLDPSHQEAEPETTTTKTQHLVLEVAIDKDAPATNLVGDNLGRIVLKTTHSKTKEIDIPIRIGPPDAAPPTGAKAQ